MICRMIRSLLFWSFLHCVKKINYQIFIKSLKQSEFVLLVESFVIQIEGFNMLLDSETFFVNLVK